MLACPRCRKLHPDDAIVCDEHGTPLVPPDALPEDALAPGTTVGEYRVDRRLGSGAFGDVYAGEQPLIGKKVAIKVLRRELAASPSVLSRFIAEARAVNKIRHQNIIDIFSFGMIDDEQPYFVMELLDGATLAAVLDRERRLPLATALPILRGIAAALDAAHDAGVLHRDLKPDNVFLAAQKDGSYFPKLLDFGVAKMMGGGEAHRTATGVAVGTPTYMAPEQCRGKKVDRRADVYALGVVVHEMLTGRRPFDAESAVDMIWKHVAEAPPPMSSVCPDLPAILDAPVLAMLAKHPDDRPSTAGEAISALIERARESGAIQGPLPSALRSPLAFEAAIARREAETAIREIAPSDRTTTSNPMVVPVSREHTELADEAPPESAARGDTLPSERPPTSALVRAELPKTLLDARRSLRPPAPRPTSRRALAGAAIAAAALAAIVALHRRAPAADAPDPPAIAAPPLAATVVPDRDPALPAVVLTILPDAGAPRAPPPATKKPTSPKVHADLERPPELGSPR
jgi:serine/threonine-protein kinase